MRLRADAALDTSRRGATALEGFTSPGLDGGLADLAYHFYEAEAWDKALDYSQRFGERAQALYAPRAAAEHFTRALNAAHHLAVIPRPELYRARGLAYETLGNFEQARPAPPHDPAAPQNPPNTPPPHQI